MCHCVRHIGLDNKHDQSVEAIHSFLSRWRAGTELCADKQEEPSGKKGSMGSEDRVTCSKKPEGGLHEALYLRWGAGALPTP